MACHGFQFANCKQMTGGWSTWPSRQEWPFRQTHWICSHDFWEGRLRQVSSSIWATRKQMLGWTKMFLSIFCLFWVLSLLSSSLPFSLFLKKQSSLFLTVGKPVKPPFFRHFLRWCFCLEQLEVKHISGVIFPSKIEDFLPKHKSLKHILYHFVAFLSFFIASFPLDIRDAAGWLDLALGV